MGLPAASGPLCFALLSSLGEVPLPAPSVLPPLSEIPDSVSVVGDKLHECRSLADSVGQETPLPPSQSVVIPRRRRRDYERIYYWHAAIFGKQVSPWTRRLVLTDSEQRVWSWRVNVFLPG